MATLTAEFDGRVFVPCAPVPDHLTPGAKVAVVLPPFVTSPEQEPGWQSIQDQLNATAPFFPSVEEALRYTRKRP